MSPEIRVITHGGLPCPARRDSSEDTTVVGLGATLADVLRSLGIDRGLVGVAAMDGRIVELDAVLKSDGVIHVYPIFGGG
jgi:sulfur carrier protein ThiS